MTHRPLQSALAPLFVAVLAGGVVFAQHQVFEPSWLDRANLPVHQQVLAISDGITIDATIASAGDAAAVDRLRDTTTRALRELIDWLGAPPSPKITIVDLPWGIDGPGAAYLGVVATRVRWIAPAQELTAERSLIAGLARQFWFVDGDAAFREALTIYTATRAIHRVGEGRNFEAVRLLGGFVPLPVRAVMLSPNITGVAPLLDEFAEVVLPAVADWRFAPSDEGSPARRGAAALQSLERLIGWPAMQQVLASLRAGGAVTPERLSAILAEQRGTSMEWFARDLVRSDGRIDYAVGSVSSESSPAGVRTRVAVERRAPGVFSGTDRPRSTGPSRSFAALIRFADGSETRGSIDGRDERTEIVAESRDAATAVIVDPDALVLVDRDRTNNIWAPHPPRDRVGLRLVANWFVWLQNVMLTYTAVV